MEEEIKKEVKNFESLKLVFSANIEGILNLHGIRYELY